MRDVAAAATLLALACCAFADGEREVRPSNAALVLPVELPAQPDAAPDADAGWAFVEVPPALFAYLERGTDDLRLVDARGREVPLVILTRDGSASAARADIEPLLVSERASASAVSLLLDLRVRAAPGLVLELDLRGAVKTPIEVADAGDPWTGPWEDLPFRTETDGGAADARGGVRGRAIVPAGSAARYVRVIVPSPDPGSVRLACAAATIPRHRVFFRIADAEPPISLLAGFRSPLPARPLPSGAVTSWATGTAASVPRPAWLAPQPGLGQARAQAPAPRGRPFPWAESIATVITLALTIWAAVLRKER